LFKGGTNLTMFQSVGLLSIGLAFILFIGLPIFLWRSLSSARLIAG